MGNYIEKGFRKIEKKYSHFFESKRTRLVQYILIGKKSEKFEPIELEVVLNKELPEEIKNDVASLYKTILGEVSIRK